MAAVRKCEICKQPINPKRAKLLLKTRLCTEHAKAIVKFGGEFILSSVLERTSKDGGLKKNYGSAIPSTSRNEEALRKLRDEFEREQFEK